MPGRSKTKLRLLGPLSVIRSDGRPANFPTQKTQALLGMIVLSGESGLHRDTAADRLWSRSGQSQARTNLRQSLASLRKALDPDSDIVTASASRLFLNMEAVVTDLDLLRVETTDQLENAERDILLQASEFLDGLSLNEAGFEDWVTAERLRLRGQVQSSLQRHASAYLENAAFDLAVGLTDRLLELDEFHEASARLHMRALHGQGETAAALRIYEDLRGRLSAELNVAPSAETAALAEAIKNATLIQAEEQPLRDSSAAHAITQESGLPKTDGAEITSFEPQRPVLAILPFANLSNDPEQDYFCIGISEDIATRLSGSVLLSVSTLHAMQLNANDQTGFHKIKQDHGVDYILTGSVRCIGSRVRITAQLKEAETDRQIWADTYDGDTETIFDLQDEAISSVVGVLPGRVSGAVAARASRKPPHSVKAYEYLMQAKMLRDGFDAVATLKARHLFEKVVDLDPTNARAWGYLQDTYVVDLMLGLSKPGDDAKTWEYAAKSNELDPDDFATQDALGYAYIALGKWDDAIAQFERTANRLTNQAEQFVWCGYGMCLAGRVAQALEWVQHGVEMDALHPPSFQWVLGQVHFFNRDFQAASETLTAAASLNSIAYACRVVSLEKLGKHEEAAVLLADFCNVRQAELQSRGIRSRNENVEEMLGGYRMFLRRGEDWDLIANGMQNAGLRSSN